MKITHIGFVLAVLLKKGSGSSAASLFIHINHHTVNVPAMKLVATDVKVS